MRVNASDLVQGCSRFSCEAVIYLNTYLFNGENIIFCEKVVGAVYCSGSGVMYRQNAVIEFAGLHSLENVFEGVIERDFFVAEEKFCRSFGVSAGCTLTAYPFSTWNIW